MFINTVKTPRNITVHFGIEPANESNHISLLTGPNGSGKTDVLASIAKVFHGNTKTTNAVVRWYREARFYRSTAEKPNPADEAEYDYMPVRLITQTFSPFSRFPSGRRQSAQHLASIYSRGNETNENYICIGFNQKSRIELRTFTSSIVEDAILRLSERPKSARVAFQVLEDLNFKEGICLKYVADPKLQQLVEIDRQPDHLERILRVFARTGKLFLLNQVFSGRTLHRLRRELESGDVNETIEYLRHAINMISEHIAGSRIIKGINVNAYSYTAFKHRDSMSSDFAYLQAFSVLSRLGLLRITACELQPIGGETIDIRQASSGQQQMLCSIFGLAAAVYDEAVVLIDEPELSLHPRWQMQFFKYLETILSVVKNCHVIMATHSPLIVQAAALHNVQVISMGHDTAEQTTTELDDYR
ncbi:AAA family ATPase [Comamonas thiooxydans]|uniref:AAA family ATPase n=1 Tax=Comamonas thiooxydans TaxID=363952 RepID=UPI0001BB17AF|nr:AAA family ATPase [Comamonas thiooxydans]ACY33188.1 hypothetical protein CtCNB1_2442 [Comamonas thiooxydans]